MNLSISVVNWNTKDILKRCLDSIYKSTYNNYEVFVVDNNSTDGSSKMVEEQFPQVKLIANTQNLGFARANNQAINSTDSKYILTLNPDVLVYRDTLESMVNFIDTHPQAGAIGIKLLDENNTENKAGYYRKFPSFPQVLLFYTILEKIGLKNRWLRNRYWEQTDTSKTTEISQIPGACLMIRRKTIEEIGLFDERFQLFFEDVDLCYRIKKTNWKLFFVPKINAVHIGAQSIRILPYQELASRFFNSMYLYLKKHHSLIMALSAKFLIILDTLLKIIYFRCLYTLSDYKRGKRLEHIRMLYKLIGKLWIR